MTQLNLLASDDADQAVLRPIHYLGNKSRALSAITRAVESVAPEGTVCDLFTGTGVVAAAFGRHRSVVAADIQEYSRVLASALLKPHTVPLPIRESLAAHARQHAEYLQRGLLRRLIEYESLALKEALIGDPERLCAVLEHGSIVGFSAACPEDGLGELLESAASSQPRTPDTVLSRYYGGVYFSYAQAAELDSLATAARETPAEMRDTVVAAVLSTASEVVSSVGNHFAQPVRPRDSEGRIKLQTVAAVARRRRVSPTQVFSRWLDRYARLQPSRHENRSIRGDYRDVLKSLSPTVSVVYADPPYTRDHYSRFYHVLETISLGDDPALSSVNIDGEVKGSRGLYRADRHQSPFCIKSQVREAFAQLIEGTSALGLPLVISYSPYAAGTAANIRLMKIEQIEDLLLQSYRHVEVRSAGRIAHSKLNAERLNAEVSYEAELLLIGTT